MTGLGFKTINRKGGRKNENNEIHDPVDHAAMEQLEKDGVDKIIGHDHIHAKVAEAVQFKIKKVWMSVFTG